MPSDVIAEALVVMRDWTSDPIAEAQLDDDEFGVILLVLLWRGYITGLEPKGAPLVEGVARKIIGGEIEH